MNTKQKTSIKDIAKKLGVSQSTVSSVLNGKTAERRISDGTTHAILAYIEKSGFRPNGVARSLRTGCSKIIGMLVEDISNPFFASIAHLVEQKVARKGYRILLSSTENENKNAGEALATFWERQVDGYIIVPPAELPDALIRKIFKQKPLVLFDRTIDSLAASSVLIDNYNSMVLASNHLIERGYKNIAFITIESLQLQMVDRLNGYKDTLSENQLKTYIARIDRQLSDDENKEFIKEFIWAHPEVDAIIFSTNYVALLGLQVIKLLNLKIPLEMGIVGFDDSPYYALMNPAITSIVQPINELADGIVQLMLAQIKNEQNELLAPRSIRLKAALIPRASTARY